MATDETQLGTVSSFEQFLLDHGFVAKESFEKFLNLKKEAELKGKVLAGEQDVVGLIVAAGIMEEDDVVKARAAFLNLPYVDLRKKVIQASVLSLIPDESKHFYHFVPFELGSNTLKVAISDPANLQALEALEFLGQKQNLQIQIYLASLSAIDVAIGEKKNLTSVVGEALQNIEDKQASEKRTVVIKKESKNAVIEDAPIIKIVDVILSNAIDANASDIHIEPSDNEVRVRYRIDGVLHTSLSLPHNVLPAIISRIKILANLKIDETRLPQDGRFHIDFGRKSVDLRVSVLPLIYGEKVVMRILDKSVSVPSLDELGIRGKNLNWVLEQIKKTHGVLLITGPTGSGKSTTLYSILSRINEAAVNIVTLEDPVEYFIEGVNQSQINPDVGLTFASGLRSILRQDPNVVMVGEIRDQETAELGVQAALTGHLVFSTLHTNNAVGAVPRLMDMGIEPFLLEASMNLVVAQRLVRKICQDCIEQVQLTPLTRKTIEDALKTVPDEYFDERVQKESFRMFKGKGCDKCGNTGYKGRMGIFEVLPMLVELEEMIFNKTPAFKIYEAANKFGVITMKQDGVVKVIRGETTLEEVLRVTTE
jgi:type IV pilus assembly protein PilB